MPGDTIFAQATARGKAGVAIIRVSGPATREGLSSLTGPLPSPHTARLRTLRTAGGTEIDRALVIHFPAGASFTGEDVVELHVHGSPAVCRLLETELAELPDIRPAEAGEFTRRALEAGRLDLAQVEGLADLIDAETEAQLRQAQRLFGGALADQVATWRKHLVAALALLTATIDFADEEVPVDVGPDIRRHLTDVLDSISSELSDSHRAERLRDGFVVAILGPPNIGKSTLLNRIARRDAAIVSDIAGTTRDIVEIRMNLNGLPVTFLDTAGLRSTTDRVETLGIARTRSRARDADLRIALLDDGKAPEPGLLQDGDLQVLGKSDLRNDASGVSGLTGDGVEALLAEVSAILGDRVPAAPAAVNERHRAALTEARAALVVAHDLSGDPHRLELAAAEIERAAGAIGGLIGRVDVEEILDDVFGRFCIGK